MLGNLLSPARLMAGIPADVRETAGALAEIGAGADLVAVADPPPALAALFEREATRRGLPPELLAAVSGTLTGYRPDAEEEGRAGLMGFPGAGPDRVASVHAIMARDPAALDAVGAAVREAADKLADARDRLGLAGAIAEYVAGGVCGVIGRAESDRCRRDTAAIVGSLISMLARRIPSGRWDLLREMLT